MIDMSASIDFIVVYATKLLWPSDANWWQKLVNIGPGHWVSGKLWYLQHSCVGDTIAYH